MWTGSLPLVAFVALLIAALVALVGRSIWLSVRHAKLEGQFSTSRGSDVESALKVA